MLTLNLIKQDTERVIRGLEKKQFEGARKAIEDVLAVDRKRREAQQKMDSTKAEMGKLSKQIGVMMKEGRRDEAEAIKESVGQLKTAEKELKEAMENVTYLF